MRAVSCELQLIGCSTRVDGSLSLRFSSPELTALEKVAFMELQGLNLKAILQPMDSVPDEIIMVKTDIEQRTPSERLRAVLFIQAKQLGCEKDFDRYYRTRMNEILEAEKAKLEKQPF